MGSVSLRVLDLFSGIGGFSLGLEATGGFETVAFCEIESYPRAVLKKHWPNVPCYEDVNQLTYEKLRSDGLGAIDVICGGFPCQDISVAGKGAGLAGERSGLWFEFARLIRECRPRWCLIENVPALRTRGYDRVKSDLEGANYACWSFVVSAQDIGAPHQRKRVWIVAYPNSRGLSRQGFCSELSWGAKTFGASEIMAHSSNERLRKAGELRPHKPEKWATGQSETFPDTRGERLSTRRTLPLSPESIQSLFTSRGYPFAVSGPDRPQWGWEKPRLVKRLLGSTTDGVSARLVRTVNANSLKALGNAVVPQIPYLLGKTILKIERELTT